MRRTNISHFSHVLAALQRTGSLPGGEIRGLPNGRAIDGLQGLHTFALELSEAQKEYQLGRLRSALERVKQLDVRFNTIACRWESTVSALISDIRQGRQLKNLEKLKDLKAAQIKMQQLVSPARKALQDLVTALDQDAMSKVRESSDVNREPAECGPRARPVAGQVPDATDALTGSREPSSDQAPDDIDLGSFAANYRCGVRLQLTRDANEKTRVAPPLEVGKFYYVAGLARPRVIRVRELQPKLIRVFDSLESEEATLAIGELSELIRKGIWILLYNDEVG